MTVDKKFFINEQKLTSVKLTSNKDLEVRLIDASEKNKQYLLNLFRNRGEIELPNMIHLGGRRWSIEVLPYYLFLESLLSVEYILLSDFEVMKIGALTDSPIIRRVSGRGHIFWYPNYQIICPIEELLTKGVVYFTNSKN